MNLPTKLTMSRLFLTIVIILLFLFPFNQMGISFPSYALTINNEILEIDSIYIISGILFIVASFTEKSILPSDFHYHLELYQLFLLI